MRAVLSELLDPVTFLANLFASSPVALAIVRPDGYGVLVNESFRDLFGSEPPPEYNMLTDNVAREQGVSGLLERALSGETIELPTFWYDAGDLETVDVVSKRVAIQMTMFPILDANGQVAYVAITYRDMTEVAEYRDGLELIVDQRTAELKSAIVDLESFVSAVSHEFKGPIRTVVGFSDVFAQQYATNLPSEAKAMLDMISHAAVQMNETMKALLRLSHVMQGPLERSQVDLGIIAENAIANLESAEPQRVVKVDVHDNLVADADAELATVLVENLIGNAWKYSAPATVARIDVGFDHDENGFYVRDNGIGFDMSQADRMFQPFQRLNSAKDFVGTGIGLATVNRIANRHGGRVWATSGLGEGSTFWFTFG